MGSRRTIAIVGAGFSGSTVATTLLSEPAETSTRIVLVERTETIARGVAFANREHSYLLNVPVSQMSACPEDPAEFHAYANTRNGSPVRPGEFLPRAWFGDYLEQRLAKAEAAASDKVTLERRAGNVQALERTGDRWSLQLQDGERVDADDVVLALGNPPARSLPNAARLGNALVDPWDERCSFDASESVLIVGTGLTMVDVVLRLAAGSSVPRIHAISRHGLLPVAQTDFHRAAFVGDADALRAAADRSMRDVLRAVRVLLDQAVEQGRDWREVIGFVRPLVPDLWRRLHTRERSRFLRHVRAHWDMHRHRMPPRSRATLDELRDAGRLSLHAARVLDLERHGSKVNATLRPRGSERVKTLTVDRVINCTGPDYCPLRSADPLMRNLVDQGLVAPDVDGLGMHTAPDGAVLDGQRRVVPNLFYIGPLLRADHWEATAVPELRGHAQRLGRHVARHHFVT